MENQNQCASGLIYNSFAVVYIQSFSLNQGNFFEKTNQYVQVIDKSIDNQIFNLQGFANQSLIKRYKLKGFNIFIKLDEDKGPVVEGFVHVEASLFFDNTVTISYRLLVDSGKQLDWDQEKFCVSDSAFNTDQLIALAGIPLGTEHWEMDEGADQTEIDTDVAQIVVSELFVGKNCEWLDEPVLIEGHKLVFNELQARYKSLFTKKIGETCYNDYNFVYIDVWEDIGHEKGVDFKKMREGEIIEHIETQHQSEMIGLLTLYPYEWPYRMSSDFEYICGKNIAIDTDDLILTNQNLCIVFGTYGLRGKDSPTDWKTHLEERAFYHVSWPEYLLIVEMIIAKKQAVNSALTHFIQNTIKVSNQKNTRKLIEQNALLTLDISNILLKLDAIRFSRFVSHKIMYERTEQRFGLEKDYNQLLSAVGQIDQSLNNVTNIREIRQANLLNIILGIISVASLFSILLTPAEIPFFKDIAAGDNLAFTGGATIIVFTFMLILLSFVAGAIMVFRNLKYKKR